MCNGFRQAIVSAAVEISDGLPHPVYGELMARAVRHDEVFHGDKTGLRLVTIQDCTERYLNWLQDREVNRYLETRWSEQSLASIRAFVERLLVSDDSYLFAIVSKATNVHVGNIKIGPIQSQHRFADVSYFIGERAEWGKGLASDAIRVATRVAFERLGLHRLQAGLYEGNVGSARALEKAGFLLEGRQRKQLLGPDAWEDHIWYGLLRDEWTS